MDKDGQTGLLLCPVDEGAAMTSVIRPSFLVDARFSLAVNFAGHQHAFQTRKSTSIPYICHPLGVASLIIEAGGDEDQAIGGLLHDIAEDCGGEYQLTRIEEMFGERVAAIVRGCSDSLTAEFEIKPPWEERKEQHLAHLWTASDDVLIVTAADKVHNARSIVTDLQIEGDAVWDRFNAERHQIIWYYTSVLSILKERGVSNVLVRPLDHAIKNMKKRSFPNNHQKREDD